MTESLLVGAFLGGLVSFLAPCVLPIILGFLAYLAGASPSTTSSGPKGTTEADSTGASSG